MKKDNAEVNTVDELKSELHYWQGVACYLAQLHAANITMIAKHHFCPESQRERLKKIALLSADFLQKKADKQLKDTIPHTVERCRTVVEGL